MTTPQYRWLVFAEIAGVCILGLIAAIVTLAAVPVYQCREHVADAMTAYARGTDTAMRVANEELDGALAINDRLPAALMLRGRIALEKGDLGLAYTAYEALEGVSAQSGLSISPALNGQACAMLLEATQARPPDRAKMAKAYEQFEKAVQADTMSGDAHVNAAICCLHQGRVVQAAEHLEDARSSRNMSYEAMVAYYRAVGSMLARASGLGRQVAAQAVDAFGDPDPQLRKTGRMLYRAADEFDKTSALARNPNQAARAKVSAALVRARILAWAPLKRGDAHQQWRAVSQTIRTDSDAMTRQQRQMLYIVLGLTWRKAEPRSKQYGLRSIRSAAKEGTQTAESQFWIGAALFDLAPHERDTGARSRLEGEAMRYLLKALGAAGKLPADKRFHALSVLGLTHWRAKDRTGAIKQMNAALQLAKTARPGSIARSGLAAFYRNFAVMRYAESDLAGAVAMLRLALSADAAQTDVRALLGKLTGTPTVEEIQLVPAKELPACMPIISVRLTSGGPVPLRKDEVTVAVDDTVVPFTAGPDGRVYVLPREPLAEGQHTIRVRINADGRSRVDVKRQFKVSFKGG
jgi:tetratricopeptide (TPR) repeat protein